MSTIGVVGEGELVIGGPRADGVGLRPQFLGLLLVVLQVAGTLKGIGVARGQRGCEVGGRGAGAVEHLLADVLAVDGHGNGLATQGAFFGTGLEMLHIGRNSELLNDGAGLVVRLDGGVLLEGLGGGGRDGLHHVEGTGLDVGVGGLILGVDLEGHAVVLGDAVALVVGVLHQHDLVVVVPRLELVRAVADRLLAEGLRILEEGFRQRGERGIADLDGEHRIGLVQIDGEFLIIDDLQTLELFITLELVSVLQRVIALDGGEEGGAELGVLGVGRVAPCLGEGFGGHRGAVGKLPTILELDGVLGGVIVSFDGFRNLIGGIAFGIKRNQTCEQQVERLAAAGLVAVARDERVLRFGIVCGDDVGTLVSGGATVGRAAPAEQHTECACGRSESQSFLLHGIHILLIHYFQSRKTLFKKKAGVNTVASTSVFVFDGGFIITRLRDNHSISEGGPCKIVKSKLII